MNTFVLPIVNNGPAPAGEAVITNDGFFPDIDPVQFASEMRVREGVTPARRRRALIDAIITVGNQLNSWRETRVLGGIPTLDAVASPKLDGESRLVQLYRSAVFSEAKARLVEKYRDTDITKAGKAEVEDLDPAIGELRRDSIHAIRDILGTTRTAIELI